MFLEANALRPRQLPNPLGPDWKVNWLLEAMELPAGSRVLLAGCGSGRLIPHLKIRLGLSGQLIAVDDSAEALARVPLRDAKWAMLIKSGLDKIPVIDDFIDTVIYPFSFDHRSGLSGMAAEFYRILKPGGRAFIIYAESSPPCPFGLSEAFLKAGFNRLDYDDDMNLFFLAAQKSAPYFFAESGSA
jgi:ubiquinone/menaquinone biosynthesis C-methylase UbiE